MAFFRIYWLRRLIRKHMQPVSIKKAATWEQRLSIWYALFAWNALGLIGELILVNNCKRIIFNTFSFLFQHFCIGYQFYIGNGDPAKSLGLKSEVELAMTPGKTFH